MRMESAQPCPLPELAEVLWPYIKPREEAARIRHEIDAALRGDTTSPGLSLSRTTLTNENVSTNIIAANKFVGVRSTYMQALNARQDAQKRFNALRAELDEFDKIDGKNNRHELAMSVVECMSLDRVSLCRQTQRQRRLQLVDDTLSDLDSHHRSQSPLTAADVVNSEANSLTVPPTSQLEYCSPSVDKGFEILQLKKAFLQADANVEHDKRFNGHNKDYPREWNMSDATRNHALQSAINELISWIESELAKLSNPHDEHDQNDERHVAATTGARKDAVDERLTEISDLYERYISARKSLVCSVTAVTDSTMSDDSHARAMGALPTKKTQTPKENCLSSALLPYIATLCQISDSEPAMMQQTSYLRRQLVHDSTTTEQLVRRLADESHLVAPGSRDARAWMEAAGADRRRDAQMLKTALETGEQNIHDALEHLRQ